MAVAGLEGAAQRALATMAVSAGERRDRAEENAAAAMKVFNALRLFFAMNILALFLCELFYVVIVFTSSNRTSFSLLLPAGYNKSCDKRESL